MAYVTWAVGANRTATVYCHHCRQIFALNIYAPYAKEEVEKHKNNHHCTPHKPWRMTNKQRS